MAKKVLVIDDSEVALQVIKDDLEDGGFDVSLTNSCREAENIINSDDRPDVILVDVMMPGMDGGSFCKLVKSRPETKDIPVVLVSMKEENEIKVIIEQVGADGYLWKGGISAMALAKIIEKF